MSSKKPSLGLFREIPAPLTPFEKTAAAAKTIIETEASKRADLTASLRAARLARDVSPANGSAKDAPPKPSR